MPAFETLAQARAFFADDLFATQNGMVIDALAEDGCTCSMVLQRGHKNAAGGVMGGAIFTLADFAFAVAANHMHCITVSLQANINFLGPARGQRLIAHAHCQKDGRTTCVYNVDVSDELGNAVAQYVGTGYKR